MPELPPPHLSALLRRLGLANAAELRRMAGRVKRLARDLPRFESVWVDALAQARILTPFQAAEINAGRGDALGVGPYVLCGRQRWPQYTESYQARHIKSGHAVRLAVIENAGSRADEILGQLESLVSASKALRFEHLAPIREVGAEGDRIWAASEWVDGQTAAEWMVRNGRFPSDVVLEIARAMLAGLLALEKAGLSHGDVSTSGLVLTAGGRIVLPQPGLRAIVRPEEGYGRADLLPEAYDYLAPERIADGTPPSTTADIYACGCVWWHLLCGRPPLAGGNSLAKLRAAQTAKVAEVQRLAPEVPRPLASAVSACLHREPGGRPESMARLAATLGGSTRNGRTSLARCLARSARPMPRKVLSSRSRAALRRATLWATAATLCAVVVVAALGPMQNQLHQLRGAIPFLADKTITETVPDHASEAAEDVDVKKHRAPAKAPTESAATERAGTDDGTVVPAHYLAEPPAERPQRKPQDLVLDAAEPLEVQSLRLQLGQRVRGRPGRRPIVKVSRAGLAVRVDRVCFQDIDFVYDHQGTSQGPIVSLHASQAEFRGCRFRSTANADALPAAVRWDYPAETTDAAMALPSGRVRLADCVLQDVEAGVDCRTAAALAIEVTNTLHLGTGPLVRLDHCPGQDEPVRIGLRQVTLRNSGPLLQCDCRKPASRAAEISIQASLCAFAPGNGEALILLRGAGPPERLLRNIRWTGQGSLVLPGVTIAAWATADGRQEPLDDAAMSIAGLVRSTVDFAGETSSGPAASRIIRWQVPLRSTDPPGFDPGGSPGD